MNSKNEFGQKSLLLSSCIILKLLKPAMNQKRFRLHLYDIVYICLAKLTSTVLLPAMQETEIPAEFIVLLLDSGVSAEFSN